MTLRHMKIYIKVYETQSITQAARELNMTQPAVTRTIQEIEHYYGVCLFERINKRLYRTVIGQQLYTQALHMAEAFENMEKELRDWDSFGMIRVGATSTLGSFLLPPLITDFQKKYPGIEIQAAISNGDTLQQGLLENRIDIALVENHLDSPELHAELLGGDRLVLILPPGHPLLFKEEVVLRDILDYPLLLREKGSTARTFLDHCSAAQGITLSPVWESVSTQALIHGVQCGIGISFLPELAIRDFIESGELVSCKLQDINLSRQHFIVWHKNKFLTGSMKNFIELCKENNFYRLPTYSRYTSTSLG